MNFFPLWRDSFEFHFKELRNDSSIGLRCIVALQCVKILRELLNLALLWVVHEQFLSQAVQALDRALSVFPGEIPPASPSPNKPLPGH